MQALLQAPGCVPLVVVAAILFLAAVTLRSLVRNKRGVSRRRALSLSALMVVAMLSFAWWFGLRETWPELPPSTVARRLNQVPLHEAVPPSGRVFDETRTHFLQVDDRFPLLVGAGWLNGAGGSLQEPEARVTVVDIWNELCPVCHDAAPGLKRVYEKYRDRDVQFVGYTPRSRELAEAFVKRHDIPWPNAYGVGHVGQSAPQVFVLDREGRILWWDDRLRLMHQPEQLETELETVIERALRRPGPRTEARP